LGTEVRIIWAHYWFFSPTDSVEDRTRWTGLKNINPPGFRINKKCSQIPPQAFKFLQSGWEKYNARLKTMEPQSSCH
jgi:hypothetical protein